MSNTAVRLPQLTRLSQVLFVITLALLFSPVGQTPQGLAEEGAEDSEDGIDLFIKAAISEQTDSRIFSGAISYEVTISQSQTEEEIQKESKRLLGNIKEKYPDLPGVDSLIEKTPEALKAARSTKTNDCFIRFDCSKKGYEFIQTSVTNKDLPEKHRHFLTRRHIGLFSVKNDTAVLFSNVPTVFVSGSGFSWAQMEQFGHLRGILATGIGAFVKKKGKAVAKEEVKQLFKKINGDNQDLSIMKIVETKPFEDGSTAITLETSVAGKVTQRFTIVPSMGYVCPKIEFYDSFSGNLVEEYEAREFVKHQGSGIYYPTYYTESNYNASNGKLTEKREYTIHQETLSLNEPMSPKDFTLEVAEGFEVYDTRGGKNAHYAADQAGVLTLEPDGLDLDKMPWLRLRTDTLPSRNSSSLRQCLVPRIALMAIGLVLIAWGVIGRIRKKRDTEVLLVLAVLLVPAVSGCSSSPREADADVSVKCFSLLGDPDIPQVIR